MNSGQSREDLAREANLARSRLLGALEELNRRRSDGLASLLLSPLRSNRRRLAVLASAVVAGAGLAALTRHWVMMAAERRLMRSRWRLARDMWSHPERIIRAERAPYVPQLIRWLLLGSAGTFLTTRAKRLESSKHHGGSGNEARAASTSTSTPT